jgi:3-deoxy-manno-octulosonate cytidylyltransferase (CMP-KDO synthetase)
MEIAGKPMVCWVAERAHAAGNVGRVIVATDSQEIFAVVHSAGYEVVLTQDDHASGTDRIAEVAAKLAGVEIVVNVQGDEPLISPETIERAVDAMIKEISRAEESRPYSERVGIVTTWEGIDSIADVLNPTLVKIVVDENERAIYFSRSPVPYPRDAVVSHGTIEAALRNEPALLSQFRKHTGLYVYRREVLLEFTRWPPSKLERIEGLEQLRALERGVRIKAIEASAPSTGVDTSEDLEKVRRLVQEEKFQASGVKVRVEVS